MTNLLGRIFGDRPHEVAPAMMRGDIAYAAAMSRSDQLMRKIAEEAQSTDPARAVMADIWAQRHNTPFLTTVVQAVEEINSPLAQRATDRSTPKSSE